MQICACVKCAPMHLTSRLVRTRRGGVEGGTSTKTGLVALKTASGMRGATSVLWKCVFQTRHAHTQTHTLSIYLPANYSSLICLHSVLCITPSCFFLFSRGGITLKWDFQVDGSVKRGKKVCFAAWLQVMKHFSLIFFSQI